VRGPEAITGGDSPDIFVPISFLHDTSNLAYAVLDAPILQELPHICSSMEQVAGCPPFTFAASAFGSALLVFHSLEEREMAVNLGPFSLDGISTSIVRPKEAENRSRATYDLLVELKADNFPLSMWHSMGANFFFGSLGKLCWSTSAVSRAQTSPCSAPSSCSSAGKRSRHPQTCGSPTMTSSSSASRWSTRGASPPPTTAIAARHLHLFLPLG
jgi:hypothetical protein